MPIPFIYWNDEMKIYFDTTTRTKDKDFSNSDQYYEKTNGFLADTFKTFNPIPFSDKLYRKTDYFVMIVESETTTSKSSSTNGKYGGGTKHSSSELWLFDTGASVHVTPFDKFLFNPQFKRLTVRVEEGTVVESHKQGDFLLQSNCERNYILREF
jgi:hypothetical protein